MLGFQWADSPCYRVLMASARWLCQTRSCQPILSLSSQLHWGVSTGVRARFHVNLHFLTENLNTLPYACLPRFALWNCSFVSLPILPLSQFCLVVPSRVVLVLVHCPVSPLLPRARSSPCGPDLPFVSKSIRTGLGVSCLSRCGTPWLAVQQAPLHL